MSALKRKFLNVELVGKTPKDGTLKYSISKKQYKEIFAGEAIDEETLNAVLAVKKKIAAAAINFCADACIDNNNKKGCDLTIDNGLDRTRARWSPSAVIPIREYKEDKDGNKTNRKIGEKVKPEFSWKITGGILDKDIQKDEIQKNEDRLNEHFSK